MVEEAAALPQAQLPAVGSVVGGKYRIERLLGEGGMGVVFEAVHARLNQRVAIKMLLPEFLQVPELVGRFEREAKASAQLRHRNAVRVVDVDATNEGIPYMVMELLHGHDLETEIHSLGPLPIGQSVHYLVQACSAMGEAHGYGIVHRDLKPSNLFLSDESDGSVCVKVLDFGISKVQTAEDVSITATSTQMGTPLYMSPEQVRSAKSVDLRTDVWAIGVILYEMLSGQPPFSGSAVGIGAAIVSDDPPSLRALRPEVPEELEAVVMRAMAKSPAKRFSSMQELIHALSPFSSQPAPDISQRSSRAVMTSSHDFVNAHAETLAFAPAPQQATAPTATVGSWINPPEPRARPSRMGLFAGVAGAVVVVATLVVVVSGVGTSPPQTVATHAPPPVTSIVAPPNQTLPPIATAPMPLTPLATITPSASVAKPATQPTTTPSIKVSSAPPHATAPPNPARL